MNRLLKVTLAFGLISSSTIMVLAAESINSSNQTPTSSHVKVLREYKGIKLGMKRAQVNAVLGKPENSSDTSDDYKLTGDDSMTVHYENGEVKAIQLAFYDQKNAPAWNDVVGDAEVNQTESGARHARQVVTGENFWVSIYQSKDGQITRITISR